MDCGRLLTDGVVQAKGFVSLAPSVTDLIAPFEDQGGDIKVFQASRGHQTTVSGADNDNIRLRIRKLDFARSFLQPSPVVRERVPMFSRLLWVIFQTAQARVHGVAFPLSVWRGDQAKDTGSESESSHFKGEDALYPSNRREELDQGGVSEIEGGQVCDLESIVQELLDARVATEGAKVPGDGEDITPERIIDEEVDDFRSLSGLNERRESGKPPAGDLSRIEIFWQRLVESGDFVGVFLGGHGGWLG